MKKIPLIFIALVISSGILAQTKRIAHRSHSGEDNVSFNSGGDNFGLPPSTKKTVDSTKTVKTKADSIPAVKTAAIKSTKRKHKVKTTTK